MNKSKLAFGKENFILLAIGMAIVIIGYILMSGPGSTPEQFNPEIFSWRRIRLAPIVCLAGFITMGYAIVHRPKSNSPVQTETTEEQQ